MPRIKRLRMKLLTTCPRMFPECSAGGWVSSPCLGGLQLDAATSHHQPAHIVKKSPVCAAVMGIQYLNDWTYLNKLQWREPQTLQRKYSQYLNLPQFHSPVKYRYCRVSPGKMHPEEKEKYPSSNSFFLTNLYNGLQHSNELTIHLSKH